MENGNEQDQVVTETTENNVTTSEDLEAVKAQLDEEKTATADALQAVAEKTARIEELETALSEAKLENDAKGLDMATIKQARDNALAKYLETVKALNPTIPDGVIAGETIIDIDASLEKGKAIVEAVKTAMAAEAAAGKVPAGAPTREAISTEGLSPREKIAAGIQPK